MSQDERTGRLAAWAVIAVLSLAVADRGFGSGARVAALRAREADLCRRYDVLSAAVVAEAAQSERRVDGEPTDVPAAIAVIEELRQVRLAIARAESCWW